MNHDIVLDLIQALAVAPRTSEQVARATARKLNTVQVAVALLRKRGLVYVVEDIPPIVGKPTAVYALQPGMRAWAVPDCVRWACLPLQERWQRRVDHYGENVIEREAEKRHAKCRATRSRTVSRSGAAEAERPTPAGTTPHMHLGEAAPGV